MFGVHVGFQLVTVLEAKHAMFALDVSSWMLLILVLLVFEIAVKGLFTKITFDTIVDTVYMLV